MKKIALGAQGSVPVLPAMPVLLVGAMVDGKPNFITVAWTGVACAEPLMLAVAIRHSRHTLRGIEQHGTFSVNVPSADLVKEVDFCGIASGATVDKVAACGFRVFFGTLPDAPLIEQCPVNVECRVHTKLDLGSHILVVGQVEECHVSASCLTDGKPDVEKIDPLLYASPGREYRRLGAALAQAFSVGKEIKQR